MVCVLVPVADAIVVLPGVTPVAVDVHAILRVVASALLELIQLNAISVALGSGVAVKAVTADGGTVSGVVIVVSTADDALGAGVPAVLTASSKTIRVKVYFVSDFRELIVVVVVPWAISLVSTTVPKPVMFHVMRIVVASLLIELVQLRVTSVLPGVVLARRSLTGSGSVISKVAIVTVSTVDLFGTSSSTTALKVYGVSGVRPLIVARWVPCAMRMPVAPVVPAGVQVICTLAASALAESVQLSSMLLPSGSGWALRLLTGLGLMVSRVAAV